MTSTRDMTTAVEWARQVPEGRAVRWKSLEVAAFSRHPRVLRALDPNRRYGRPKAGAADALTGFALFLVALLGWVILVFPSAVGVVLLTGAAKTYQSSAEEARVSDMLPAAAAVYGLSFLIVAATMIVWSVRGREKRPLFVTQSVFAVVFGVWGIVVTAAADVVGHTPTVGIALGTMGASTAIGIVFAIAQRVVRPRDRADDTSPAASEPEARMRLGSRDASSVPLSGVTRAVGRLTEGERMRVRNDIAEAVGVLEARGLISNRRCDQARRAPLGALALHMSRPPATA